MSTLPIPFTGGLVTRRSASDLAPGEMTAATGIFYKPGDTSGAWTVPSATNFATAAATVKGLVLCQFDSGADQLVAMTASSYLGSPSSGWASNGLTGSFSNTLSSVNSSATTVTGAHMNDRWYLANGYNNVQVLASGGTSTRDAGLYPPITAPTVTTSSGTLTAYKNITSSGSFTNSDKAYDAGLGSLRTFAYALRTTAGSTTGEWTFDSTRTTGTLDIIWAINGGGGAIDTRTGEFGVGGVVRSGYYATVLIETKLGSTYTPRMTVTLPLRDNRIQNFQLSLADIGNVDSVRFTLTYAPTFGTYPAVLAVFDIANGQATSSPYTMTGGFYYAFTEFDATNQIESAPSPASIKIGTSGSTITYATLTLPTKRNTATTHFRIYRTSDDGAVPLTLGRIGEIVSSATTFIDNFGVNPGDVQPTPIVDLLEVQGKSAEGTLAFYTNQPPPTLRFVHAFRGSLVGLVNDNLRALRYSEPGFPERWPEINVIDHFPMAEHDTLVAIASIGDGLILGAQDIMIVVSDLPRVLDGVFNTVEVSPLKGQPGVVGPYAMTAYSVSGESRVAWVSRYGIYETNGSTARRISNALGWETDLTTSTLSTAVLHWDPLRQVLKFSAPSDTKYWLLHMSPEHAMADGQPKITGPFAAARTCMVSGQITSGSTTVPRQYASSTGSAVVSTEHSASAPQAITVTSGRINGDWREVAVHDGVLRASSTLGTVTVAVSTIDTYNAGITQSQSNNIDLTATAPTQNQFWVGRAGENVQVSLTGSPSAEGRIQDVRLEVERMGHAGRVA